MADDRGVSVEIFLLGRFDVRVDDRTIPPSAWSRRQAASLVKLLALAPRRQLHREQVMDALWPEVPVDEATPRLHKAAYFARRVLGPESIAIRSETVMLFPDAHVSVDSHRFQELGQDALDSGDGRRRSDRGSTCTGANCCPRTGTRPGPRRPANACTCSTSSYSAWLGAGPTWWRPTRAMRRRTSR